jgi:hypothetical protein
MRKVTDGSIHVSSKTESRPAPQQTIKQAIDRFNNNRPASFKEEIKPKNISSMQAEILGLNKDNRTLAMLPTFGAATVQAQEPSMLFAIDAEILFDSTAAILRFTSRRYLQHAMACATRIDVLENYTKNPTIVLSGITEARKTTPTISRMFYHPHPAKKASPTLSSEDMDLEEEEVTLYNLSGPKHEVAKALRSLDDDPPEIREIPGGWVEVEIAPNKQQIESLYANFSVCMYPTSVMQGTTLAASLPRSVLVTTKAAALAKENKWSTTFRSTAVLDFAAHVRMHLGVNQFPGSVDMVVIGDDIRLMTEDSAQTADLVRLIWKMKDTEGVRGTSAKQMLKYCQADTPSGWQNSSSSSSSLTSATASGGSVPDGDDRTKRPHQAPREQPGKKVICVSSIGSVSRGPKFWAAVAAKIGAEILRSTTKFSWMEVPDTSMPPASITSRGTVQCILVSRDEALRADSSKH